MQCESIITMMQKEIIDCVNTSLDQVENLQSANFTGQLGCIWSCIVMAIIGRGASCFTYFPQL